MKMTYTKNCFDILVAFLGIIFFLPIFIIISILLIVSYRSINIIFIQKRIGRNGMVFNLYKFRTMVINSSSLTVSVKGDARITPIGRFLRKYKLDELPELWNILIGKMSFVGPRPDVPGYADKLVGNNRRMLLLKPGLTGVASLKYIDEEELLADCVNPKDFNDNVIFPDKVRINLLYLDQWSFILDIRIIADTILRRPYVERNYFKK